MINEIATFVDSLKPEHFTRNLEPKEGLYVFLDLNSSGELESAQKGVYNQKSEFDKFFDKCLKLQVNSIPIDPAKIFNPNKKIFGQSCSPFGIAFNKKNLEKYREQKPVLETEIQQYLKTASQYILTEQHEKYFEKFKAFCSNNLIDFIEELEEYQNLKANAGVFLFMNEPSLEEYKETHQAYLKNKVFNRDDFNKKLNGELYGISDKLNTFQDKKVFLRHQTAPLEFNYRVSGDVAMKVWKFFQLTRKQLPNPTPIFIDRKELNENIVSIFNDEGEGKISFSEVIKSLIEKHKKDLQNYYLIFLDRRTNSVTDLDFVPQFRYYLEPPVKIKDLFPPYNESISIENIFQLENQVFNPILDNQLVIAKKDGTKWLKYFDDLEYDPKYFTENTFQQLLNYRKAIYDYVYKSQKQAFNASMFHDILKKGILEDIRLDEPKDQRYTKNQGRIKQKLNIWLNLFNYFTNSENNEDMVETTKELQKQVEAIANDSHLNKEDENADRVFAFAAGQLINRILLQSESSNRSHALLEPFLQKSDPDLFKREIAKTFETYKHKFKLYPTKYEFDKVMSEVMGYEPIKRNMKDFLPFILAGYFAESVFSKKNESNNN